MRVKYFAAALLTLSGISVAIAQRPEAKPGSTSRTITGAAQKNDARRNQARALLTTLSSDARLFTNSTLRAESLADIADLLWDQDASQSRGMFRRAFEAAESADIENEARMEEEIRQKRQRNSGGYSITPPDSLRIKVIRLVTQHDFDLGEELSEKLAAKSGNATRLRDPKTELSPAKTERLEASYSALMHGEVDRALQLADVALGTMSVRGLDFLVDLNSKAPATADKRFSTWLATAATSPDTDANTIGLFLTYLAVPHDVAIYHGGGGATYTSMRNRQVPLQVSPEVQAAFLQLAADILLKPTSNINTLQTNYLNFRRLMPYFEQNAPPKMLAALQAQFNLLENEVSEQTRRFKDPIMHADDEKKEKAARADSEQEVRDRLAQAKTSSERDSLELQLALIHTQKGEFSAHDELSRIADSELRKAAQAYVDMALARSAIEKRLIEQALELVAKGELTHFQKVWVLTRCARMLPTAEKQRSIELIEAATDEANRIDSSDPLFAGALFAIANTVLSVDKTRIWETAFAAVKAANSIAGFTGEDVTLTYKLEIKGAPQSQGMINDSDFKIRGLFGRLTDEDFDRAVEAARGLQGEGPRAVATIEIARRVLAK